MDESKKRTAMLRARRESLEKAFSSDYPDKSDEDLKTIGVSSIYSLFIKINSISIFVEIIARNKIHIYGITILLNQSRQRQIIKINRSTFTSNQFHKSMNFFTQKKKFLQPN